MCNRAQLIIDLIIDYHFFQSNRNRIFLQNSNRNRNPVKKSRLTITNETIKIKFFCELF
jgi:hypothetical protein